ncbi:hypothetical protein ES707_07553 [subsurface metagenome]
MTIRIENIVEYTDFRPPNKRVLMLEVHYRTGKEYRGVIHLDKAGATRESIIAAVKEAASLPEMMIGEKLTETK